MTTHYLTAPLTLVVVLLNGITDEPILDSAGKAETYDWARMIRAACFDPRMKASAPGDNKLDVFEINELRLLARMKPGEVREIGQKEKKLLVEVLTRPHPELFPPTFFTSGGADLVRAIVDAPTTDPREATKASANGKPSEVASA